MKNLYTNIRVLRKTTPLVRKLSKKLTKEEGRKVTNMESVHKAVENELYQPR